ncbi:MAG: YggT family protein [Gemmatimonadales bacterium]|nr:YggT family protein [Gemmatimonadales bacterium]
MWPDVLERAAQVVAAGGFAYAAVVFGTTWAVRQGHLQPFGAWPRLVRSLGDPLLKPLERRLLRSGGNPVDAPLWLFGSSIVVGLVLVTATRWLISLYFQFAGLATAGPRMLAASVAALVFNVLQFALLIRVLGSWFGITGEESWMRPVRILTDWLLDPLRRIIPPFGPFDLTPLAAYFALRIAGDALVRALAG